MMRLRSNFHMAVMFSGLTLSKPAQVWKPTEVGVEQHSVGAASRTHAFFKQSHRDHRYDQNRAQ